VRGVKLFLKLDTGVTRGQVPQDEVQARKNAEKRVRDLQGQLHSTREELSRARKQLSSSEKSASGSEKPKKDQDVVLYDGILFPPLNLRPTRRGKMGEEVYFEATREEVD